MSRDRIGILYFYSDAESGENRTKQECPAYQIIIQHARTYHAQNQVQGRACDAYSSNIAAKNAK